MLLLMTWQIEVTNQNWFLVWKLYDKTAFSLLLIFYDASQLVLWFLEVAFEILFEFFKSLKTYRKNLGQKNKDKLLF